MAFPVTIQAAITEIMAKIYDNTTEDISGHDSQDIMIMLAEMFKVQNVFEHDPTTIGNPPTGSYFMGANGANIWLKDENGNVTEFNPSGTSDTVDHDFDFSLPSPYTFTHNKGKNVLRASWIDSGGWIQQLMVKNISVNKVQVSTTGTGHVNTVTLVF